MPARERLGDAARGGFVAFTQCPLGTRLIRGARWFIGLFSPASVIAWLFGLSFGTVFGLGILIVERTGQGVVLTELRETDGLIVQGGRLNILVGTDKTRDCPTTTARFLWRWVPDPGREGQHVKMHIPLLSPPLSLSPVGSERSILSLPLPSDIQPGDGWYYASKSIRDCSFLPAFMGIAISQSPNVPLRVLTESEAESANVVAQEGTVTRPDLRP